MNDYKYDRITWVMKQIDQLIADLELDELHTRQKIERLHALDQELEDFRKHYERDHIELFRQERTEKEPDLAIIESDAA